MKHLDITVSGKVQGVFFRASTQEQASQLGITGWVRNNRNGTVDVAAEGRDQPLGEFLGWLEQGPPGARVEAVECEPGEIQGYEDFSIQY